MQAVQVLAGFPARPVRTLSPGLLSSPSPPPPARVICLLDALLRCLRWRQDQALECIAVAAGEPSQHQPTGQATTPPR